jgi:hypothetical protein
VPDLTGQLCPGSIHALYRGVTDGLEGPGWHPPTDSSPREIPGQPADGTQGTNCYFGHEHGSSPWSVIPDYNPNLEYVNMIMMMPEAHHEGKDRILGNADDKLVVEVVHHGTTTRNVLCGQFHAWSIRTTAIDGTLLAERNYMIDFGKSVWVDSGERMTPPECDGIAPDTAGNNATIITGGQRRVPNSPDGYTPYVTNMSINGNPMGDRIHFSHNSTDGVMGCEDKVCTTMFRNGTTTGSRHRFQILGDMSFNYPTPETIARAGGTITVTGRAATQFGDYCITQTFNNQQVQFSVVDCETHPMALHQYHKPGESVRLYTGRSDAVTAGQNALWHYDGAYEPMTSVKDGGSLNGADPLLTPAQFDFATGN